jgi:hypothetical protein
MIRVNYQNVVLECDTADDAIAVARKLASGNGKAAHAPTPITEFSSSGKPSTQDQFQSFMDDLTEIQKKVVMEIGAQPQIPAAQLNRALGFESNMVLSGHVTNIGRRAERSGIQVDQLWKRVGTKDTLEYASTPRLRAALQGMREAKTSAVKQTA